MLDELEKLKKEICDSFTVEELIVLKKLAEEKLEEINCKPYTVLGFDEYILDRKVTILDEDETRVFARKNALLIREAINELISNEEYAANFKNPFYIDLWINAVVDYNFKILYEYYCSKVSKEDLLHYNIFKEKIMDKMDVSKLNNYAIFTDCYIVWYDKKKKIFDESEGCALFEIPDYCQIIIKYDAFIDELEKQGFKIYYKDYFDENKEIDNSYKNLLYPYVLNGEAVKIVDTTLEYTGNWVMKTKKLNKNKNR